MNPLKVGAVCLCEGKRYAAKGPRAKARERERVKKEKREGEKG